MNPWNQRAAALHSAIEDLKEPIPYERATRVLEAIASFHWFSTRLLKAHGKDPKPWPTVERCRMQRYRREDREWRRSIVRSPAFRRSYDALPGTKLPAARQLLSDLSALRRMTRLHKAGKLDPHAHALLLDHEDNLAALRDLAQRFPDRHRAWIADVVSRIESDLERTIYCDPWRQAAPLDLIGTRGAAGDPAKAFRGWMIRSADRALPEAVEQRGAAIAELLTVCGLPMQSGLVNSTLREWNRKAR